MDKLNTIITNGITITWHIDDVQTMLEDRGYDVVLTPEQMAMVLHHVKKNHDATIGVTWDSLEYAAEALGFIQF